MRRIATLCLGLVALCLLAGSASAQPRYRRAHDGGLLLRLAGGIGYGSATLEDDNDTGFQGGAIQGSFAIGGNVAPGLALNVDFFGMTMFAPSVVADGEDLGDAEDTSVGLGAIGVGLTGYIMPVNLYLAASVGVGIGSVRTDTSIGTFESETDPGFALNLMIGKEWFVSPRWGIGLAGQLIFASLEDESEAADVNFYGIGVLLSATYN